MRPTATSAALTAVSHTMGAIVNVAPGSGGTCANVPQAELHLMAQHWNERRAGGAAAAGLTEPDSAGPG